MLLSPDLWRNRKPLWHTTRDGLCDVGVIMLGLVIVWQKGEGKYLTFFTIKYDY